MHTISFEPLPTMKVNIHNQCSGFNLTNGGYFSAGTYWNESPNGEVKSGSTTSADLTPFLSTFGGVLAYRLEEEYAEATYIRLLVAWKSEGYKKFRVFVHLIEHEDWRDWSKVRLEEYYQRYASQLSTYTGPIKNTWLIEDDIVLMTALELDFTQRDDVLNITISESVKDEHTKRPVWFKQKR
jgi:hypothetical protein